MHPMRSRENIENSGDRFKGSHAPDVDAAHVAHLQLEVLLDIRDLLIHQRNFIYKLQKINTVAADIFNIPDYPTDPTEFNRPNPTRSERNGTEQR